MTTYPEYIMRDLRQRLYDLDDAKDTIKDDKINQLDPVTAFKNVVDWRLGNGWGDEIIELLESCGLKVEKK